MKYGRIKKTDIANGPGVRVSLFVSGCRNHCKGCFQPETWDFNYGEEYDGVNTANDIVKALTPDYISGLSILGGDPMEPENQAVLLPFLRRVKAECPKKDIWAYTGYILEKDLVEGGKCYTENTKEMLELIDVLVDGPFIQEQYSIMLKFKGSANQRLIDCKKFCEQGIIEEIL